MVGILLSPFPRLPLRGLRFFYCLSFTFSNLFITDTCMYLVCAPEAGPSIGVTEDCTVYVSLARKEPDL